MKFPAMMKFFDDIQNKMPEGFAKSATKSIQSLLKIKNFISSFGDVAGKGIGPVGAVAAPFRQVASSSREAASGIKHVSSSLLGLVGLFSVPVAIAGFFATGIKGAVSLRETISKVETVFGSATNEIKSNADEMAKAFGLPKGAILDASRRSG